MTIVTLAPSSACTIKILIFDLVFYFHLVNYLTPCRDRIDEALVRLN